jgi:hypothetical protein
MSDSRRSVFPAGGLRRRRRRLNGDAVGVSDDSIGHCVGCLSVEAQARYLPVVQVMRITEKLNENGKP